MTVTVLTFFFPPKNLWATEPTDRRYLGLCLTLNSERKPLLKSISTASIYLLHETAAHSLLDVLLLLNKSRQNPLSTGRAR